MTVSPDVISRLIMPVDTNIKLDSVIMSDENRKKVEQFLQEMKHSEKLVRYGLKPTNRLLFYGDSGCGKTYLSKALANYLHYTMLYVDIANSIATSNVSQNISAIFEYANQIHNCVIFLDECDSIAWNRDAGKNQDSGDIRRATNTTFQQLDQMHWSNLAIAATNLLPCLDPAFARRFDDKLEFRRPKQNLPEIIDKFLFTDKGFRLVHDVNLSYKTVVEKRIDLSYYTIQLCVERAMKNAVIHNTFEVSERGLYESLAEQMGKKITLPSTDDSITIN